jgi:hypothetical protein
VVPGEDGKLVKPRDKIPASGRVAGDEDSESDDGEKVHLRRVCRWVGDGGVDYDRLGETREIRAPEVQRDALVD